MIRSMTGYGRAESSAPDWTLTWEVKSVNSRYLDLKWRLPSQLRSLETELEKVVREVAGRGRLEVTLNFRPLSAAIFEASLNLPLAETLFGELAKLAARLGVPYTPDLNRALAVPALWADAASVPPEALAADVRASLRAALADWNESRGREGATLAADISARLATLGIWVEALRLRVPVILADKSRALTERLQTALAQAGASFDEGRILQEVAVLADRLDVSEELTRLGMHLARVAEVMAGGKDAGKRLDFLFQEVFREINTCGNKCQDAEISSIVVDFKAELEKCREQVQNIE